MTKKSNVLISPKDVREYRGRQIIRQNYFDPLTGITLDMQNSVQDHCHQTQRCRQAMHRQSNAFEGKVANAYIRMLKWLTDEPLPVILRRLADYLEEEPSKVYHPGYLKKSLTLFMQLTAQQRSAILQSLGLPPCKNDKARKEAFKKYIRKGEMDYQEILDMFEKVKETK